MSESVVTLELTQNAAAYLQGLVQAELTREIRDITEAYGQLVYASSPEAKYEAKVKAEALVSGLLDSPLADLKKHVDASLGFVPNGRTAETGNGKADDSKDNAGGDD
jgi:hypothetical protein